MSLRLAIVEADPEQLNVAEFCRQHGISTWFFWEQRRRHRALGPAGLEPRSRAPKVVANRTAPELEDAIVSLRKELGDAGLDNGAASIGHHLGRRGLRAPSDSTIWRVLVRRGFVVPQPNKAPRHSFRSFSAERANECWQLDDTAWELADGTLAKILNVIDDCTRVVVASRAMEACTSAEALNAFVYAAEQWGWPERFLSDNARAFRMGLAAALRPLGIGAGHSRPFHPQTCGKVERFHQSLKRFLSAQPRAIDLAELQSQLDSFAQIYNHLRPHRSLGRQIPAEVWARTPKSGPVSLATGTKTKVHRVVVAANGTVDAGRGLAISLGAQFIGRRVTVIVTGLACHVFADGRLIRGLTIDPTRRLQRLYDRPGHPKVLR